MSVYCVWNNKGGTGKTSLSFQMISMYANDNPDKSILVLDMCPQANLSELFLGGMKSGGSNLQSIIESDRKTVGGYFQQRILSPYMPLSSSICDGYVQCIHAINSKIPQNIDMLVGDPIVELQTGTIAEQAFARLPADAAWPKVVSWLRDFVQSVTKHYDDVFIDANPSFSMYTQIALATSDFLIIPTMADDSSRRAILNVLSLIYGIGLPDERYKNVAFSAQMSDYGLAVPKIKLIVKNRLTQYMGPASAFAAALNSIDKLLASVQATDPTCLAFGDYHQALVEVRDFGTTGVVSFLEATPFFCLSQGDYFLGDRKTHISREYIEKCKQDVNALVAKLG